jgi:hypothetical protein
VLTLVAHQRRDVDADLRVMRPTQTAGGQAQYLGDARAALQQDAQDDCVTRRSVVDHVTHSSQNREPRRLRIARHRWFQRLPAYLEETHRLLRLGRTRLRADSGVVRRSRVANPLAMLCPPGEEHLRVHRVVERIQRMEALILRVKDTPPHDRVEAPQRGDQQVETVGADRRPVAGLDEPPFNATLLEGTPCLEQKLPCVLTHSFRLRVPWILMPGQEAEPGPQDRQYVSRVRAAPTPSMSRYHSLSGTTSWPSASNTSRW